MENIILAFVPVVGMDDDIPLTRSETLTPEAIANELLRVVQAPKAKVIRDMVEKLQARRSWPRALDCAQRVGDFPAIPVADDGTPILIEWSESWRIVAQKLEAAFKEQHALIAGISHNETIDAYIEALLSQVLDDCDIDGDEAAFSAVVAPMLNAPSFAAVTTEQKVVFSYLLYQLVKRDPLVMGTMVAAAGYAVKAQRNRILEALKGGDPAIPLPGKAL